LVLEDRLLVWKLRRGSRDAFCRIYEKHRDDLLRLATALLSETGTAEDVVHDVFTCFVRSAKQFHLTGSLRGYLATCVANRARNVNRAEGRRRREGLGEAGPITSGLSRPDQWIIYSEELEQLSNALAQLPYDQREVIILHLQGGMKFREIARVQNVSVKTVQSRCRYGLDKLRALLNSELEK
jgi:RNA polymerase sigma-70 factor (ECF subfamily)